MSTRESVVSYLEGPETTQRRELEWGMVREAPGPSFGHQSIVTHLGALIDLHVRLHGLGRVVASPIDVVLDEPRALVVQPDLVFVAAANQSIIRTQVWGAPDLVIEVLSPGTVRRDRIRKLAWYRRYGVREYWIVNPAARAVEVYPLQTRKKGCRRYGRQALVQSTVLPDLRLTTEAIFA